MIYFTYITYDLCNLFTTLPNLGIQTAYVFSPVCSLTNQQGVATIILLLRKLGVLMNWCCKGKQIMR